MNLLTYNNYIKARIVNLHEANERIKDRQAESEAKVLPKLYKLLDAYAKDKITPEQYVEMCADVTMAFDHGSEWFFNELDRREDDAIQEDAIYQAVPVAEIQEADPINVAKHTKDFIDKKGLFEND